MTARTGWQRDELGRLTWVEQQIVQLIAEWRESAAELLADGPAAYSDGADPATVAAAELAGAASAAEAVLEASAVPGGPDPDPVAARALWHLDQARALLAAGRAIAHATTGPEGNGG